MDSEKKVQAGILTVLGGRRDMRLFRNTVGHGITGNIVDYTDGVATVVNARRVTFGLCEGSSDLIGIKRVTITPEMVGKDMGVFVAIEVKSERGRPTKEQAAFVDMVNRFGGVGVIVRSVEEAGASLPPI
jgi:peroxiredoxin family protein